MPERSLAITVGAEQDGRTIAAILKQAAGVSQSVARGIVAAGRVKRNDETVADPAHRAAAGDVIAARFDPHTRYAAPSSPRRKEAGFRTVLEDKAFIVVDKPAGVLTVPTPDSTEETLVERVAESLRRRGFGRTEVRAVHRIDRPTSGLVLVARTPEATENLVRQFALRAPLRLYLAVCEGSVEPAEGTLVSWLVESPESHKMRPTSDRTAGREAVLHYQRVEAFPGASLVRVRLETGRHNQIRVQFAERGWPLVGDRVFGHPSPLIRRAALHAERLAFDHPVTGRRIDVEAPPPADFELLLHRLRSGLKVAPRKHPGARGERRRV
jgi:23S rRNA pseudouridine1911/1915/1917 synthase